MSCPRPNTPRSDPRDWGQLANPLRDRLWTMCEDFGLYAVSLYRDPGRQWDLRHERVPGHECDPAYKGHPTTAVPAQFIHGMWVGGSKHQHREAGDVGGARLLQAKAVCHEYGLIANVPDEDWHYQKHPTLSPTRPIRVYPGPTYNNQPPPSKPEGWLMALTDKEQDELLDKTRKLYEEICVNRDEHSPDGESSRHRLIQIDQRTSDLVTGKRPSK